jgi:multimeric flavodoxin WrbA
MKTLLIVYHSMTGGTLQMANAAVAGATREPALRVRLLHAPEAQPDDVLEAAGYLFASPEYLGSMAGLMKDFFERCYYPALDRVNGRPYASLVCAGSDGQGAVRQIDRIATGLRLRRIAPALVVCTHAQAPQDIAREKKIGETDLARCGELGAALAAGMALGIY